MSAPVKGPAPATGSDVKPDKRPYKVAVGVAVAVFASGAVAIGAAASMRSSGPAKTVQAAAVGQQGPPPSATPVARRPSPPTPAGKKPATGKKPAKRPAHKRPAVPKARSTPRNPPAAAPVFLPAGTATAGASPAPTPTPTASHPTAPHPTAAPPVTRLNVSGEVSCVSGNSVEGVWVQAAKGSAFAPWRGLGNGSTSQWWFTLPTSEPYSLHVGCGGTTASWKVADFSPTVSGASNSFNCFDVAGQSGYGTCRLR